MPSCRQRANAICALIQQANCDNSVALMGMADVAEVL